jgi:hypothetical protein
MLLMVGLAVLAVVAVLLKLQEAMAAQVEVELLVKVMREDNLKELELVAYTEEQAEVVAQAVQEALMVVGLREEQAELV